MVGLGPFLQPPYRLMMRRRTLLALLMLAAVALGAAREFLFLNLNYQIDAVANHRAVSYAHSLFRSWTAGLALDALLRLKWALAVLFIASTLALSITFARIAFGDHRYRTTLVWGFVLVGALALVMHLLATAVPPLYGVSVKLLHVIQYPVVLFVIWAAAMLPGQARSRP